MTDMMIARIQKTRIHWCLLSASDAPFSKASTVFCNCIASSLMCASFADAACLKFGYLLLQQYRLIGSSIGVFLGKYRRSSRYDRTDIRQDGFEHGHKPGRHG